MTEDIIFRRRNRLKKHFVNTSNVLLYGYTTLSDAAKITFQVIDGFDWEDTETEDSKGYVFPSVATIARIRNTSERTIFRHLKELEDAKLLTRVRRRNKPSILYIEDISSEEADAYLLRYVKKAKPVDKQPEPSAQPRTDKNGSSQKASELTKMAVAYKKENETEENEINVNEDLKISDEKKRYGMQGMKDILQRLDMSKTRETKTHRKKEKPEVDAKREYYAQELAAALNDQQGLGCYRTIVKKVPQTVTFEILASVKETWNTGKIRKSRGALFVEMIKTYCEKHHIDLGFHVHETFTNKPGVPIQSQQREQLA